jgi:hypothetical protein
LTALEGIGFETIFRIDVGLARRAQRRSGACLRGRALPADGIAGAALRPVGGVIVELRRAGGLASARQRLRFEFAWRAGTAPADMRARRSTRPLVPRNTIETIFAGDDIIFPPSG